MNDEVLSCEMCGYWTYADYSYRREFDVRCDECLEPGCPARGEGRSLVRVCFACCGDIFGGGQHHGEPYTIESNNKGGEDALGEIKKLNEARLVSRSDQEWEMKTSEARIERTRAWLRGAVVDVSIAQALGGDVEKDDQFSAMVDRMYDGLRDSLTRQDLLAMVLSYVYEEQRSVVDSILRRQSNDLGRLNHPKQRDALLGIEGQVEGQ